MPEPVALHIKVPDAMNTLGSVMNIASQAQALKKSQATYGADVSRAEAESRSANTAADFASATLKPRVEQQQAIAETAKTGSESARFHLQGEQAQKTFDSITALLKNPAVEKGDIEVVKESIDKYLLPLEKFETMVQDSGFQVEGFDPQEEFFLARAA